MGLQAYGNVCYGLKLGEDQIKKLLEADVDDYVETHERQEMLALTAEGMGVGLVVCGHSERQEENQFLLSIINSTTPSFSVIPFNAKLETEDLERINQLINQLRIKGIKVSVKDFNWYVGSYLER